jgi:hypothetical protein
LPGGRGLGSRHVPLHHVELVLQHANRREQHLFGPQLTNGLRGWEKKKTEKTQKKKEEEGDEEEEDDESSDEEDEAEKGDER